MSPEETDIVADLALRLEAPRRERNAARLAVAALAALAIDLAVGGLVWFERDPVPIPQAEEIPVEIVVEPPPPPPPPPPSPPPAPQPAEDQDYMKPAFDAPREGKSDRDDEHVADKEKPVAAPPPPAATPSPEASTAPPPPAPEAPKAADADLPAPQETPQPQPEKAPAAVAKTPLTFDSVPDIDFGGEAMNSPVNGGTERSTYLSQIVGLIKPHLRVPPVAHTYGRTLNGVVNFEIDGRGRLIQRYVASASGSIELDEAVMQAIGVASSHFPKPPHGRPVRLVYYYATD